MLNNVVNVLFVTTVVIRIGRNFMADGYAGVGSLRRVALKVVAIFWGTISPRHWSAIDCICLVVVPRVGRLEMVTPNVR